MKEQSSIILPIYTHTLARCHRHCVHVLLEMKSGILDMSILCIFFIHLADAAMHYIIDTIYLTGI